MLPVKAICDRRARKDGTNPICIQYCYRTDQRTVLNTEIYVPMKYWHKRLCRITAELPPEYGSYEALNTRIKKQMRAVEDLIDFATEQNIHPLEFVKAAYKPDIDTKILDATTLLAAKEEAVKPDKNQDKPKPVNPLDIYYQINDYIKSKEKKTCKDMPRIYANMRDHLKEFEQFRKKPITFSCLDLTFYEEFVDFLTYDYVHKRRKTQIVGLKVNTVGKTIKQFRTFLRNRMRKRIIPPIDMEGWTILEEEVDAIYFSEEEIRKITDVDLSNFPELIDDRNDTVLGCLTGLRFSDFSKLDVYDLRDDMLHKKQQKSEHWVVIPLRPEALTILQERFNKGIVTSDNGEFNKNIKLITKLAGICDLVKHSHKKLNKNVVEVKPKYAWATSHTCRRSFCTNEFLAGTPVELIMKISGHKSVKDFYKYIRISPEEAGRKIKEIWKLREQLIVSSSNTKVATA
nr:phage integrase SAM-like domain-containing protein [Filimonas lacunae]